MNIEPLMRRVRTYPVASVLAGLSFLMLVYVGYRHMGQSELESRLDNASTRWRKIETNVLKNSVNLETHLESVATVSQDVKERLIQPLDLAKNYQYFYRLESGTGVDITTLQQDLRAANQAPKKEDPEAAKKPKPLFSKVGYTMAMNGDFYQMLELLHALENGYHFYQLRDFTLQRATEDNQQEIAITMNFDLLGTP